MKKSSHTGVLNHYMKQMKRKYQMKNELLESRQFKGERVNSGRLGDRRSGGSFTLQNIIQFKQQGVLLHLVRSKPPDRNQTLLGW